MSADDVIKIIVAVGVLLAGTVFPGVVLIIKEMREGRAERAAGFAIQAEQQNRYLATRGAEPVTMQSPPMGTGDGRIDKAVTNQLANAPTSPSTVPVAPPAEPLKTPEPPYGPTG